MKNSIKPALLFAFSHMVALCGFAQIPCPSSEKLNLPPDATAASPKACVNTALPAFKSAALVSDGPSLSLAAKCGTLVTLKPGKYGSVTFPSCTAGNWLVVKVLGDKTNPGERWRPTANVATFDHITAGTYNRIGPGIEVKQAVEGGFDSTLIDARGDSHVVILRSHIAGTITGEVAHAIIANGSDHIAVVGNVIEEIKCKAGSGGKCSDAQGFLAGCGASGAGFLVENNIIEASTEGILFGGCGATTTASDSIIERNHIIKPLRWMLGQPDYVGTAYTVKNCIELKNAVRTLIQYNFCENSWGGFSQDGYCLLLTPKNQSGGAPNAQVSDVIVRYNKCIAGGGLQFAAARDTPPPNNASSLGTANASVHDNLFIIDPKFVSSRGLDLQLTRQDPSPTAAFTGISIRNNTFSSAANAAIMLGGQRAGTLDFSHNILWNGKFGSVANSGNVGDCGASLNTQPTKAFIACWPSPMLSNNYVVGGNANWPLTTGTPTLAPYDSDYRSIIPGLGANVDEINSHLVP